MNRAHAFVLLLAMAPALGGCMATSGDRHSMNVYGLTIERIEPDHRVRLAGNLTIDGDARLTEALRDGGTGIRDIVVLERMPPVYVVTFSDGEVRRYRSRIAP